MLEPYAEPISDDSLWTMPVVAETYDGVLNDINGQPVTGADVRAALDAAAADLLSEGNFGGGTGMIGYGSRAAPAPPRGSSIGGVISRSARWCRQTMASGTG